MSSSPNSTFIAQNLWDALQLVSDWEEKLENPQFLKYYTNFLEAEAEMDRMMFGKKRRYKPKFHPELIKIMSNSKALMHPQLLPEAFPTFFPTATRNIYLKSEEW